MTSAAVQSDDASRRAPAGSLLLRYPTLLPIIGLCCICAGMLLPFVDKPFHMDDPMFLWTARQIQKSPLNFYGFSVSWQQYATPMSDEMKNPPLAAYYIAVVTALFGWGEVTLHLAFLLISMATGAGMFFLARRFTAHPFLAAALAILSPAFLVSASSVMSDVPALCLWVWAIVAWIHAVDHDKPWLLPIAGLLVAAGAMTKYPGMNLIPLLAAYAIMHRRRLALQIVCLLIPVAALIAYQIATKRMYGKGLLTDAAGFATQYWQISPKLFTARTLICLAYVGGSTLTAALLLPLVASTRVLLGALIFAVVVALIGVFTIAPSRIYDEQEHIRVLYLIQLALMTTGGTGLLVLVLRELNRLRDRDTLFLALWIGGTFFFTLFINWAVNARTILPMVPALTIVVCRVLEKTKHRAHQRALIALPTLAGAAVTMAVINADYSQAVAVKKGVDYIASIVPTERGGSTLWFMGHWGFQWYMEKIGGVCFDGRTTRCEAGDWVVMAINNYGFFRLPSQKVQNVDGFAIPADAWISTANGEAGSGFYFAANTQLPFIVSPVPPETFIVSRVVESFAQPGAPSQGVGAPATQSAEPISDR